MKHTKVVTSLLLHVVATAAVAQTLRSEINLSDPFIMADSARQTYYMTGTGGGLWQSKDLEIWTGPTYPVSTTDDSWMGVSPQVWASEIYYADGMYYNISTFTNSSVTVDANGHPRRGVHILSSTLPEGAYTLITDGDATYVPEEKCTLDGTLFTDTDGTKYLLYCHEWIQNGNGTVEAVRLRPDMKGNLGEATVLFRAKDAAWNTSPVTDGPFAFRTQTGRLGIIWTSWHNDRYVQGVAYSTSGTMAGPWQQQALPITPDNYGHGMLLRDFKGQLLMSIHSHRTIDAASQRWERHPTLFVMDDSGDNLRAVMEYKANIGAGRPAKVVVDNPEFDYGTQGWTCTANAQNRKIATNQGGSISGNFYECWDANSFTGEIYQQLSLPNGTYQVEAAAFAGYPVAGGSDKAETVVLFANEAEVVVAGATPQTYTATVTVTNGQLRFGLRSSRRNYQWMGIDNVVVRYYGSDSYSADQLAAAEEQRVYLRNVSTGRWLNAGNAWGTQAILADHPLDLHLIPLQDASFLIDTRLNNGDGHHYAAANGYLDGVPTCFQFTPTGEATVALSADGGQHYWGVSGTTVGTGFTNAAAPQAQWQLLMRADLLSSLQEATAAEPADATFLIDAPQFGRNDTRVSAWTGHFRTGGDVVNYCAESTATTFCISQLLNNIPNGYYELRAQGFYRDGTASAAHTAHQRGTEQQRAKLFAGDTEQPLPSVFNPKPTTTLTTAPASLSEASARFSLGHYACSLIVAVTDNQLRIGIRKDDANSPADDWTVFDNFELSYLGTTDPAVAVNPLPCADQAARSGSTACYDLQGRQLPHPKRGIAIMQQADGRFTKFRVTP